MMKRKNIFKSITLMLSLAVMTTSCNDFLDVNDNPNDPSVSAPRLTLPVAQQSFASLNAISSVNLGQYMVYNWTTPSNWSANQNLIRYNVTTDFSSTLFETPYSSIFKNLQYIEDYEDASGAVDYSVYDVISATIKGFQYQYLVDLYGDVPYSEANLRSLNTTPKYDDAETVYKANIENLTNAAILALDLPENAENPESQDIIFGGDMDKWAAFANTIKLRMLIRLSNTGQDTYINEQIALINANGAGYITEDVVANPGYSDDDGKQSPFYGSFVQAATGEQENRKDYTVATDYTMDYLTNTNDPRMERLYEEAANGGYHGAEQSTILPGTGFTSNDLSKVGPGLLKSSEQDQPIMMLSEALFLQAEAAVRGYLPGGDAAAEVFFKSAIEASFVFLGVDDAVAEAQTYYAQPLTNIDWASSPDKIRAIITQKWIALNGTSSLESWIELTRTGFPSGLPIPAESGGVRPVRLLYPTSERTNNSNNVPAQVAADAFTQNPFWK
ncbi:MULTISPECIES: SusD/RagB family nutrient-binding outer membrane lipoprotein [unclassified Cellulophaga]|uniref:SusD/RagB family nutrient-binding outer membrane lipoprotein n=1 Tax=unclassified Cellulophaga TaxID=2634405 RepID=UPI0026E2DE4D|nr:MULTISPECIES: SusD/RagB family nutrient-binding outer membrane lipoprotein [unclassified Cellulophaga]MDO6491962.1 SusD/RagB family nutrient-binding outer membrane lipoprotein [Cellulophaga sp. 2_MG-2023]MDO6495383.1 SusD/RagB family nutrient-binding outer membrane lipoprotein [Cellulophaga sp. 3_MG-2023]